ncbi:MAG: septum formation protein [Cellvibrionaceae bacterium]|jgi:septum formation protein
MTDSTQTIPGTDNLPLVLASSSPYRRALLEKLHIPFVCVSPNINEQALASESPTTLVKRLALEKAQAVARQHPDSWIIGSDQVAVLDGEIITKPRNHQQAHSQLRRASGQTITFVTGLCLYNRNKRKHQSIAEPFQVEFLELSDDQIENYLQKEKPYDCAGSFKSEGLGIALLAKFQGKDPNCLIGLPLIQLVALLRQEGIEPLV